MFLTLLPHLLPACSLVAPLSKNQPFLPFQGPWDKSTQGMSQHGEESVRMWLTFPSTSHALFFLPHLSGLLLSRALPCDHTSLCCLSPCPTLSFFLQVSIFLLLYLHISFLGIFFLIYLSLDFHFSFMESGSECLSLILLM